MTDPLLTSLCSICHVTVPKYKCPRCSIRTCSLPCTKKHKAWSECSGQRDPTTYVPPSRLRTAAGVDHDYNFLHGIELSIERSEKLLIEERGLVQQEELRPLTMQQVRWKTGRDGTKRKVLVTQALREVKGRKLEKGLAHKLNRLNVHIVRAPLGMARQKDNHTTLNKRTGRINWQVEWLKLAQESSRGDDGAEVQTQVRAQAQAQRRTVRTLSKVMDDVPLYQAYHAMLEDMARAETGIQSRRWTRSTRAGEPQSWANSRWNHGIDCAQDPSHASWVGYAGGHMSEWPGERDALQRGRYKFYLAGHEARSGETSPVTALDAGDCLCNIVTNTRLLEFPSIYILDADEALPPGYVLAPKDTVEPRTGLKRKEGGPAEQDDTARGLAKRRKRREGTGREDGEVSDSGDEDIGADEANDASKGAAGLEVGEILAEQSLGEDEGEDDEGDEDDDTSSSGSDSD